MVPCKGIDADFDKNIKSLYLQDYDGYKLWFIVEDESDPAYCELVRIKEQMVSEGRPDEVRILVAGLATNCGQKVHNLLYACRQLPSDTEMLAFADSDICAGANWLGHLIYPLRLERTGCASGYRWFVCQHKSLAMAALSAMNAKIAELLGNTRFNQVWGGSMAIKKDVFEKLDIFNVWQNALSDDYTLSWAVKNAGLKVAFVPGCLVPSYGKTTCRQLIEFARRQFTITRITSPKMWFFGLFASLYSVIGLWMTVILTGVAFAVNDHRSFFYAAVACTFLLGQFSRAVLRQRMAYVLFPADRKKLGFAAVVDILFFWLWSILLLILIISTAFSTTIKWRGVKYKMLSPTKTQVI
jgi:cellulose synthase/poly-beta-1,6-N-acetylglucosamine synthase-like glycosyltransferase